MFEIELLSIGMVLDHIQAYTDLKTPADQKVRKANANDIAALKSM